MRKPIPAYSIALIIMSAHIRAAASSVPVSCGDNPRTANDTVITNLREIVVEGSGGSQIVMKSTAPMQKLDATNILASGVTDISDAMRRMAGVNLKDYGGAGGMKTVSVRGLGTQHTGVLYDGVSLGETRGGQIDLSRYSVGNMNSISLIIGDSDDLSLPARASSSSSTLSISTIQNPKLVNSGSDFNARLRIASFGTINPFFIFSISDGASLGMSISGEYIHAKNDYPIRILNGSIIENAKRNNSRINLGHTEINGIWEPSKSSRFQAKVYWFDNSRHLPGPVTYYNSESNEKLRERNIFGQVIFSTRIGNNVSVRALAKYDWASVRYSDKDGKYADGLLDQRYYQQEEYASAAIVWSGLNHLKLSYVTDFWHNALRSNLQTDNSAIRNSWVQAFSARWAHDIFSVTAKGILSLIHDASFSAGNGRTTRRFSPTAGISVKPLRDHEWRLRTSYKGIFRMPSFNELYFDHYGSVNLNPEITEQINIGTTWNGYLANWLPELSITADGYLNFIKNKIVAVPYNMFVMTMTNLGKVRVFGADLTLNSDFKISKSHDLLVSCNYSYQRTASRTDRTLLDWNRQVAYTPLNSGAFSLTWKNPWVNFVVHGAGCSARYSTNINLPSSRIPGYIELGVTLYREFKWGSSNTLEIRADLINALDKRYEIIARYPMPGRNWSVSVNYRLSN